MRVALVGSSGYIAKFIIERIRTHEDIEKIVKIDKTQDADIELNLEKPEEFDYSILENFDYIIFTAAISSPDKCATDYDLCWKVNVIGTSYFIKHAIKKNCRILFFSSDAVFGDVPGKIYDEYSKTYAETPYGKMKKAVEDQFRLSPNFKAVRLSYVVSAKDKFVTYCLSCIRKNIIADVFHPLYRNCISMTDVIDVVDWLIYNWDEYEPFVLNVAGKELVSRVRIVDEINRKFNNVLHYKISKPEESFYRNRPSITQMRSLYLNEYHIIEDNTFTEKIQKELEDVHL